MESSNPPLTLFVYSWRITIVGVPQAQSLFRRFRLMGDQAVRSNFNELILHDAAPLLSQGFGSLEKIQPGAWPVQYFFRLLAVDDEGLGADFGF